MIRPLKDTDYMVTKRLFQNTFCLSEDQYFPEIWINRNINATLGMWEQGALIGAAIVAEGKLEYIFIDETQQSQGFGSKLLHAVLNICPNIHLNPVDDPVICRWYERNGFRLSQEMETPWGIRRCYVRHSHYLRVR